MTWTRCSCFRCPLHPDAPCTEIHDRRGRCPDCRRQADVQRGRRQARGYDRAYDRARTEVLKGADRCVTCGCDFTDDNPATGGHVRAIRDGGSVSHGVQAQCRRCNYGHKDR